MQTDSLAIEYLAAGPPFLGESTFKDKELVKSLGARWNAENKKWAAGNRDVLATLIRSNRWRPTGLTLGEAVTVLDTVEANTIKEYNGGCMKFDRRGEQDCMVDPERDKEVLPNGSVRVYARFCTDCGVLLDSRLQFGLECDCVFLVGWNACPKCHSPIRHASDCPHCE